MRLIQIKKCFLLGLVVLSLALSTSTFGGNYTLQRAKVDGGDKDVLFMADENTKSVYWCDSTIDDSDPKHPKTVRAWRKVEKHMPDEEKKIEEKKAKASQKADMPSELR